MNQWISKLVIGVVGSVVAGLLVWVITQRPWTLDPPSVALTPRIPQSIQASEVFPVSFSAENQRDRTETGCGGYVSLQRIELEDPALRSGETAERPDMPALSRSMVESMALERDIALSEAEISAIDRSEIEAPRLDLPGTRPIRAPQLSERPDLTEIPRITRQPELIQKPELPALLERREVFTSCNTEEREFELDPVGSRVSIAARCIVSRAGDYRMIYGVRCDDRSEGEWAIQGEAEFHVDEP